MLNCIALLEKVVFCLLEQENNLSLAEDCKQKRSRRDQSLLLPLLQKVIVNRVKILHCFSSIVMLCICFGSVRMKKLLCRNETGKFACFSSVLIVHLKMFPNKILSLGYSTQSSE